jgi:hypothetical protein
LLTTATTAISRGRALLAAAAVGVARIVDIYRRQAEVDVHDDGTGPAAALAASGYGRYVRFTCERLAEIVRESAGLLDQADPGLVRGGERGDV